MARDQQETSKSTARTAGSYIALCIVEWSQQRGYGEYTLEQARATVAYHMLKRREYWRRVDEGTLKPYFRVVLSDVQYPDDNYAGVRSGLDSFWFRNTERNWREMHGKVPRPFGLS